MSEREHESRRDEIAAYLLGALEPEEAASLERHLATGCVECRAELRWLEPAVQLLPEAVERVEPPRELRARILAEASSDIAPASAKPRPPAPAALRLAPAGRPGGCSRWSLAALGRLSRSRSGGLGRRRQTSTVVAGRPPGVTAMMIREGDAATLHLANVHQLAQGQGPRGLGSARTGRSIRSAASSCPTARARATTTIPDMRGVDSGDGHRRAAGRQRVADLVPMVTADTPVVEAPAQRP